MENANKRIGIIKHDLAKLEREKKELQDSDDDDDSDGEDDLGEMAGLKAELAQLEKANAARQAKLEEYEKHKKWNVDNLSHIKEERTMISPSAGTTTYTETGYVKPKDEIVVGATADAATPAAAAAVSGQQSEDSKKPAAAAGKSTTATTKPGSEPEATAEPAASAKPAPAAAAKAPAAAAVPRSSSKSAAAPVAQQRPQFEVGAMETYHEFTEKYADVVEDFMKIPDLEGCRTFLLQNAGILLQENASNYLLLASLEDEMNGEREKMKRTARQSQIVSNIAELAKSLHTHPGNVIEPFFARLQQREHLEEFLLGVTAFQDKIIKRAVTKKQEIDEQWERQRLARAGTAQDEGGHDLSDIPKEQRLGPGGLDPLEVIETLPAEMVAAFESRDVEQLKQVLLQLDPEEAEYHMKRCVDSGLWVANAE